MAVEALGAKFLWGSADKAASRLADSARKAQKHADTDALTEGQTELLCALFVEGVRMWEGVVDEKGAPLPCTEENRKAIPSGDKVTAAVAYLGAFAELEQRKALSGEQPTASTPVAGSLETSGVESSSPSTP